MMKPLKIKNSERGQSFVELALILPLLLVLVAGVIDLGRLYNTYLALRDAAQEGANYGSIAPIDLTAIEKRVRRSSNSPIDLNNTEKVQIETIIANQPCAGNSINVRVTHAFEISAPFIGGVIGQAFPISANVTNTILTPPCAP